jgi:hypothetical protein
MIHSRTEDRKVGRTLCGRMSYEEWRRSHTLGSNEIDRGRTLRLCAGLSRLVGGLTKRPLSMAWLAWQGVQLRW